jgi:hypothetical protein
MHFVGIDFHLFLLSKREDLPHYTAMLSLPEAQENYMFLEV